MFKRISVGGGEGHPSAGEGRKTIYQHLITSGNIEWGGRERSHLGILNGGVENDPCRASLSPDRTVSVSTHIPYIRLKRRQEKGLFPRSFLFFLLDEQMTTFPSRPVITALVGDKIHGLEIERV